MRAFRLTTALFVLGIGGCSDIQKSPPIAPSAPVAFSVPTGKIAVAPIKIELPDRRGIGTYYRNVDCWVRVRNIMSTDFPSATAIAAEVRKTLQQAKLTVVPGAPADAASATGADYLLIAMIPTAHADLCIDNFFNDGPADIDAQVAVSWKLVSVRDKQVVFETNTSGTARASDPNQKIDTGVMGAVDDATKQLLQTVTVQQYLTFGHVVAPVMQASAGGIVPPGGQGPIPGSAPSPVRPAAVLGAILIPVKAARSDGATFDRAVTRQATLPFSVAGSKPGTGFVIGDGYVLTTASNLGDAVSVTFVPTPGKTAEGRVMRKDADLDLALLKVDEPLPSALPLQPRRVAVGDKVYGVAPSGVVAGTITATKSAGGHDQVKLDGASAGSPVLDGNGNVIGMLQPNGNWLSIGSVFRALNLGAQLSDE
jgi:S1-C subfamily serine protease